MTTSNKTNRTKERTRIAAAAILKKYAETGSIKQTAKELGCGRGRVRRVLHGLDKLPRVSKPAARPSILDPYKPMIRGLILEEQLTATLVLDQLQEAGYKGGYTTLKDFVRTIRPARLPGATIRVPHPPGEEGQVDWSPYSVLLGGERVVVHGFGFILPFSRWSFVRFTLNEQLETLISQHEQVWEELGAVPVRVSYDNMTTVGRHVAAGKVKLNQRFARYAAQVGFDIHLIDPGRPNQHAPVERNFHYIENNCLRRRAFRFKSLEELNAHAAWWCDEVANVRVHGTTRERPVDRLQRERVFLRPVGGERHSVHKTLSRTVSSEFCVTVDTNSYSVSPRWVGRTATVHAWPDRLEVLIEGEVVARHAVCEGRHQRVLLPEHEAEYRKVTPSARLLEQAFLRLGPQAERYYEGLKAHRGRGAGYHLKRILSLADRHGSSVVSGAMEHAARYGNYSADAVQRVVSGKSTAGVTTPTGEVPMPPERVKRWLEGLDVESRDLADYDALMDAEAMEGDDDGA